MKKIVFDGQIYAQRLTGQYRYADEILKEFDKIIDKNEYELIVPNYVDLEGKFKNIKVVKYGNVRGLLWSQISLALYLIKNNAISLNFCNITTFFKPGISAILDISYKVISENYTGIYGKLSSLWHRFFYMYISLVGNPIITISEFSKKQLSEYYHVDKKRIHIISCGWQHYNKIKIESSISDKYPQLKKNKYYLSLGSLEERKNFRFIQEIAKRNPKELFVIVGGKVNNSKKKGDFKECSNLIYLGYLSDGEAKYLLKNAKAFIFPSTFEGFGIPPLEALSLGTPCICSNSTSIPEICENSVHYVDPYNYDLNLDDLMNEEIESPDKVLDKYSWDKSARLLYDLLKKMEI